MGTDDQMLVEFSYPPKELNPNARLHWAKKRTPAKRYRYECFLLTRKAIAANGWRIDQLKALVEAGQGVHLFLDIYPPDRRPRDDDNIIAAFKAGRDGLADALNIDDRHFRIHPVVHRDQPVAGGMIRVSITSGPGAARHLANQ